MSPTEKAAILVISLGEELAGELLRSLPVSTAKRVLETAARLGPIDEDSVATVQKEFQLLLETQKKGMSGGPEAASRLLMKAFNGNTSISEKDFGPQIPHGFREAEFIESKSIFEILNKEQPQTAAMILANLSPKKAGEVLNFFQVIRKGDILLRMASLTEIDQETLEELADTFRESLERVRRTNSRAVGGIDKTAAILASMSSTDRDALMAGLAESQPQMAGMIQAQLWTFEDVARLDAQGMEILLRAVTPQDLEVALRRASDTLKARIFRAMSSRRAEQLKENIQLAKPVPVSKVDDAQRRIAAIAAELIAKGSVQDPNVEAV